MDLMPRLVDPFLKSLGPFTGPHNVVEAVKGKVAVPFFEEIFRSYDSGLPIGAGDVGNFLKAFLKILGDDRDAGSSNLVHVFVIIQLADDPISPPVLGPLENALHPYGFPVI